MGARNPDGQIIGSAGVETWNEWHKRAEIVYELHPDYWGRGLMTTAMKQVMHFAYQELKAVRLEAFTLVDNPKSSSLLARLAFKQEATLKNIDFLMVNTLTLSSTHTHNKPISIYVHLPWCIKRCLYCDFNAHQQPSAIPNEEYYQQLMKDLDDITPIINNRPVTSIFFGGGTPNLCPPWLFSELLNTIAKRFTLNNSVEITMEANPGASHLDTLGAYQKAGINRLSIGVQSFNSQHLQLLGRIHNPKDALAMVEHAHTLGFNSINIDIMYGLPLQTPKESVSDVEQALALPIDHLSWYHLTIEPNTHTLPSIRHDEQMKTLDSLWKKMG